MGGAVRAGVLSDVAVIGASAVGFDGPRRDLQVDVVDQLQAGVDGPAPRIGNREPIEQLTAGVTEQIRDRARIGRRSSVSRECGF
jgi:hypothetical protein